MRVVDVFRARILFALPLAIAIISLPLTIFEFVNRGWTDKNAWLLVFVQLVLGTYPWVIRFLPSTRAAAMLIVLFCLPMPFIFMSFQAGFLNTVLFWCPILVICSAYLVGVRFAILVVAMIASGLLTYAYGLRAEWFPSHTMLEYEYVDRFLIEIICVMIATVVIAWIYETNLKVYHEQLDDSHDQIVHQQAQLAEQEKMASLGEMAANIAHEINNSLAIISLKVTRTNRILNDKQQLTKPEIEPTLTDILTTVKQISKIIESVRRVASNTIDEPLMPFPLRSVVDDVLVLCEHRMKESRVHVDAEITEGLFVQCRPVQLTQVLANLVVNSIHAVEGCQEKVVWLFAKEAGDRVQIFIEDSGPGIPADLIEKVFEPFFTTKKAGKGTGLGLSLSRRLMDAQGGKLWYDRESKRCRFIAEIGGAPRRQKLS